LKQLRSSATRLASLTMSTTDPTLYQLLLAILKASRPAGWCFGPILFGIGLIHSRSIPKTLASLLPAAAQSFSLSLPLCTSEHHFSVKLLLCVCPRPSQCFSVVFGMNDVYDYDSDVLNPRKIASGLEGGALLPTYHPAVRLAAYLSTTLILLTSLSTLRPQNVVATTLLVLLGWQYSASPLRLKEVPLLDSLSNGSIVFLSWFVGYSFGDGSLSNAPGKGYTLALCTAGVHALGAVMDVDSDAAARQRTIATFLGSRPAAIFGALA